MVKKNHSSHKVYIVEDILDTKINGGCQFYKVKWKGYTHAECTWEPEESFNCSKDILNQFLQDRAKKQPSFKEKLRKIQREKDLIDKNRPTAVEKTKHIQKSQKNAKQEEKSESFNSEESGNEQSYRQKQSLSSQTKRQYKKSKKTPQKHLDPQQYQSKSKNKSQNPAIRKEKNSNFTKPTLKPSILPKKEQLEIMKVQKVGQGLRFYVRQNDKKVWKSREQMHQKYLRELCEYYEKHLSFDA